jgi:hypothetical protein
MRLVMDWLLVDWLILALVTPVIIVVVVLLYGFVGCGSFETAPAPPAPQPTKPEKPTELIATAAGPNVINVTWKHGAGGGVKFELERRQEGATEKKTYPDLVGNTFPDTTDLKEGTTYRYTVAATLPGFESDPSDDYLVTTFPEAPVDVEVIPQEVEKMGVKWTNKSTNSNDVIIRNDFQGKSTSGTTNTPHSKNVTQPVELQVLKGSVNQIRVFAVMKGYRDGKADQDISSVTLPAVVRKSLAFGPIAVATDQVPTLATHCLVQRIASSLLENSGKIRLWLVNGSPTGNLVIERFSVSQPAAGGNEYDSEQANIKKVNQTVSLPAGSAAQPVDVDYSLDQTKDLLIAFDIDDNAGECRYNDNLAGATLFYKASIKQAFTEARDPDYAREDSRLYFVERIEVF